ncbi:putative Ion-translocating oxidoreductase complex subunit A [Hollandina sp. SP2]
MLGLLVFSGFTLNLVLHGALGIGSITEGQEQSHPIPLFQLGILFVSVFLLWVFASYGLVFLAFGFLEYALLFPLSVLVCMGLEGLCTRLFPSLALEYKVFNPATAYDGLALGSLMMSLHIARTIVEALVLSLGFSLGTLLSMVLLEEIRKRSSLELVPPFMQGRPLMLISMGLLSLLFTALGLIFFSALGIF